ncbi:hypothetical protein [Solicola sp. PLA-1-18]|uniref:hypothetical protein n=1 Tax=Solicola sp. PLA-1-18 TaxID=3380532 RepID=UPI003B796B77
MRLLVVAPVLSALLTLVIAAGLLFVFALVTLGREEELNRQCDEASSRLIAELDGPDGEYQGSAGWSLGGSFLEPSCTYSYRGVSGTITLEWGFVPVDERHD